MFIKPENKNEWLKLRAEDITSTEVAALFGCSPYITLFELWHRKKNKTIVELEENDRMKWGIRLQDTIAAGIAEDKNWKIRRINSYARDPELKLGASFDFGIGADGILEVKNVDGLVFKDGWIVDGENVEAPPHIELQVQQQLLVSGRQYAYIGALVGGNRIVMIRRVPDEKVFSAIKSAAERFWCSVASGIAPDPDFKRDAEFICQLYNQASAGKVMDGNTEEMHTLATEYEKYRLMEKEGKEGKASTKAQIYMKIEDTERVKADGFTITAGLDKNQTRVFRILWRK